MHPGPFGRRSFKPPTAAMPERLSVAQDHHCAIVLLLQEGLCASAFALLRLEFEAYLRGAWLAHCASEDAVLP